MGALRSAVASFLRHHRTLAAPFIIVYGDSRFFLSFIFKAPNDAYSFDA
jgi:hypothetical protein